MSFVLSRTNNSKVETTSFTILPSTNNMLVRATSINGITISTQEIMSKAKAKVLWKKLILNGFS